MDTKLRVTGLAAVVAAVAAIAAGPQPSLLAAQKKPAAKKAGPAAPPQVTWPLPPDEPRVRFVAAYRGADDFKTKQPSRWKSLLLGDDDRTGRSEILLKPYGVAVSTKGRIYVTDTASRRVFAFDPDAKTVTFVGEGGAAQLAKPIGVAVDDEDNVFVADASLNRIFGYGPTGTLLIAIGHEGELKTPSGLAIDRERKLLYVADSSKHQILCYSTVDGASVRTIGKRGGEPGEFNFPTNLFVDAQGRLYVADTLNFRIQVFDPAGLPIRAFGVQGDGPGTFNRPKGVAVDSEGHIYVVDSSFNNFQIFDPDGTPLLSVGSGGPNAGQFMLPAGLFIDSQDRIYVADQGNSRVQIFQYVRAQTK